MVSTHPQTTAAAIPVIPIAGRVRVLVADDHEIVCASVERIIAAQPDMEVCATAVNGAEALAKARALKPAVTILDLVMKGMDGLSCARAIRRELPECEVAIFTGMESEETMRDALATGAKGLVLKSDSLMHVPAAIRSLAAHKPYYSTRVAEVLFGGSPAGGNAHPRKLTRVEIEIVRRIALGDNNRQLAGNLGVNDRTAETYRAGIMRKMNFKSIADLVRYAVRNEIVEA